MPDAPFPPPATLIRPRLISALRGRRNVPLTLVVAPAGCGKTTLLAQYAEAFAGPAGWLRVEPMDAAPDRLRARLCAAVPRGPAESVLIIDDFHFIDGSAAEGVLDRLLAEAPPGLQVIVGSRRMPNLNLSRHELAEVTIIDADQLRFRAWEVDRLLREVYGEPLPADEVATLSRRLAGWAAGLQLFHLSTRGRPLSERRQAVVALDGRSKLSRAYLTRTVLADLPDRLRDFLVKTCVFDTVTAARCDELLGTSGSQAHLEALERLQALTDTHDNGHSFRYHEVLRAHLCATLAEEIGDAGARRWHARAAAILRAEGAAVEAARAYARAEDWAAVRRLLAEVGAAVAAEGLEPWRDLLPSWLVAEDPWLALAEGRHRLTHGQLDAAITAFERAEANFTTEAGRARCHATRLAACSWLPGASNARVQWSDWLRAATRQYPAVVAAESERLRHPAARLIAAIGYLLAGNVAEAGRVLAEGTEPAADGIAGLGLRLLRAGWAVAAGDPHAHLALAELAAEAEQAYLPWLSRVARALHALDRTEPAIKEAEAVADECERIGDPWGAALALGLAQLGRSLSGRSLSDRDGDPDAAAALLSRVRTLDAGVLVAWAHAFLAQAVSGAGLPDADLEVRRAESLARAAGVPGARVLALSGGRPEVVCGLAAQAGLPGAAADAWARRPSAHVQAGPGADATVTVSCFGSFRLCVSGEPLDLSAIRPRARALVRILAMHGGRPVHRDTLVAALWPEATAAAATRSLHVAISSLRGFLEANVPGWGNRMLRRDGDAYLLVLPQSGYSDVAAFHEAMHAARHGPGDEAVEHLRAAVAAYGGDLLPEDGAAEWVVAERETLRRQASDAAAALAAWELGAAAADRAVAAAQRSVDIDQWHDTGWRLLIAAHRRAGNLAAAEQARRRYADVLASLGLDPAAADDALAAVTHAQTIPPPRSPRSASPPVHMST